MKIAYILTISLLFLTACSKTGPPNADGMSQECLGRLAMFYNCRVPTNIIENNATEWGGRSLSEGSRTTFSLVRVVTDEPSASDFVKSFSNRIDLVSNFPPVKNEEFLAKANWWIPHSYNSSDSFILSQKGGNRSGVLSAYIVGTPTNRVIFLDSVISEK